MKNINIKKIVSGIAIAIIMLGTFSAIISISSDNASAQESWTKIGTVLSKSASGWDDVGVFSPCVIKDGNEYIMYYGGTEGIGNRIGFATSSDGITWTKSTNNPILDRNGNWENDVHNPSVIKEGDTYKMWYSGYDGKNRVGYATSTDGINWVRSDSPVVDVGPPGSWDEDDILAPTVIKDGSLYKMWYQGHSENGSADYDFNNAGIGYATSTDGINWTKYSGNPVLNYGSAGEWDSYGVGGPTVIKDSNGIYHMWYFGSNGDGHYKIGYATSTDGISWTKHGIVIDNTLSADADRAYNPSVFLENDGTLKMWYTGYNKTTDELKILYATSSLDSEDSSVLLSDDFESYPVNTFPTGYNMMYNGAGDSYQKITASHSHSGTQSFTLKGADSWSVVVQKKFNRISNIVKLTGWLMSEQPTNSINSYGKINNNIAIGFWNASADTWGEYYGNIAFGDDGIIKLGGGESVINLTHYQPYVWYKVGVEVNIRDNTVKAYVNDTLMAETTLKHSSSKINAIFLGNGWSGVVGYIDDIELTESSTSASSSPPSPPQNLQAILTNGNISLSWNPPSNDGSSPIIEYKIYRGTSSGGESLLITLGDVYSYTDTTVSNGQIYYYRVSAVNSVGESLLSNEVSARATSEMGSTSAGSVASAPILFQSILIITIILIIVAFIIVSRRRKVSFEGSDGNKSSNTPDSSYFPPVAPLSSSEVSGHHRITKNEVDKLYGSENGSYVYGFGDFFSYRIIKKIGSGGFSEIYLVEKDGKHYAMKVPKGVNFKGGETLQLNEEDIKSYAEEAKIWATLTEKVPDSVVDLIDIGIRPFPWFAMELADYSLKDKMNMPMNAKLRTMANLLRKLEEIHGNKVVHKDIKPENILYAGGQWKFTDFGLSKIIDKSSKSTMLSGTPWYMAPEQVSPGGEYGHSDVRTDVWGMGVVLYEMLTGVSPFKGERYEQVGMAILFQEPKKPSDINPEIPKELDEIVMKALKKKKDERWQSAEEFRKAIERFLEDTHV